MNNKTILPTVILTLISLAVFVSANQNWFYSVGSNDYQLTIEVREGWNLLQGFHPSFISAGSQITANIKAVFMYIPDNNKYLQIYPYSDSAMKELDAIGRAKNDEYYDDAASLYAYWVYIENIQTCNDPACEVQGGAVNKLVYTIGLTHGEWAEIPMKKGWNFVGINPNMYNGKLDQNNPNQVREGEYFSWDAIKGDCTYEKIYYWNPEKQSWNAMASDLQLKSYDFDDFLGNGMLVKVSKNCNLKKPTISENISPPALP